MALMQAHFFSHALNVQVSVDVILPEPEMGIGVRGQEAGAEQLPRVLYLLHGYSDDHTIWLRRTAVDRYAAGENLAVVMPAVNHSFYTNEAHGERYWDFVAEELPEAMHRFFRLSRDPADTYAAGLSMGGYGAMKLALRHPERFAAAASFSGVLDICDFDHRTPASIANMERIFGDTDALSGSENDLLALLRKGREAKKKPRLYVSCGTADFLWHMHGRFVLAAEENGWDITHREIPGMGHQWELWDREIEGFIHWIGRGREEA
ncbi:MAG: esterase family protein [Clostridia bacterium]|nr:esterase family protein [Clostridia bacterium]